MDWGLLLTVVAVLAMILVMAIGVFVLVSFPPLLIWLATFVLTVSILYLILKRL